MSGADTSYVKGGGAGLPTAAGADEVPVSTGAGTTYTATPLAAAVGDTLAGLYGALDAGDFYVSDGAGVVPASSVASTVRAEIGVAVGVAVWVGVMVGVGIAVVVMVSVAVVFVVEVAVWGMAMSVAILYAQCVRVVSSSRPHPVRPLRPRVDTAATWSSV